MYIFYNILHVIEIRNNYMDNNGEKLELAIWIVMTNETEYLNTFVKIKYFNVPWTDNIWQWKETRNIYELMNFYYVFTKLWLFSISPLLFLVEPYMAVCTCSFWIFYMITDTMLYIVYLFLKISHTFKYLCKVIMLFKTNNL